MGILRMMKEIISASPHTLHTIARAHRFDKNIFHVGTWNYHIQYAISL